MINQTGSWAEDQLAVGTTVYDAAGEKIGEVAEYDTQAGYLLVQKGWFFVKDIYIPTSAITRVDENGVQLNVYKDDLQGDRYARPPIAGPAGLAGTVGSATTGGMMGTTNRVAAATDQADIAVPVREEELVVGTQQQEAGRVHIHKEVEEVPATAQVTLQQERVTVERVPYSGTGASEGDLFQERDIEVPVMGEEAVVAKRVTGVEEVRIRKDVVSETEQVSDTVRKEHVEVDGVTDAGAANPTRR